MYRCMYMYVLTSIVYYANNLLWRERPKKIENLYRHTRFNSLEEHKLFFLVFFLGIRPSPIILIHMSSLQLYTIAILCGETKRNRKIFVTHTLSLTRRAYFFLEIFIQSFFVSIVFQEREREREVYFKS